MFLLKEVLVFVSLGFYFSIPWLKLASLTVVKCELGVLWEWKMFSQKSNVIFVQYHLDYCKNTICLYSVFKSEGECNLSPNRNVILNYQ